MNEQAVPSHNWRDLRYQSFYKIVDQIVLELQNVPPQNNSVVRRKLGGAAHTLSACLIVKSPYAIIFSPVHRGLIV